jgi:hypothetical protein
LLYHLAFFCRPSCIYLKTALYKNKKTPLNTGPLNTKKRPSKKRPTTKKTRRRKEEKERGGEKVLRPQGPGPCFFRGRASLPGR